MYWAKTGDDTYEVLDGQQRTISLMEYVDGNFSIKYENNAMNFDNLPKTFRRGFLITNFSSTSVMARTLRNSSGSRPSTLQENGSLIKSSAMLCMQGRGYRTQNVIFRRQTAQRPVMGTARVVTVTSRASIRQEILETAIEWIADRDGTTVDGYMSAHQNDPTAQELWSYFRTVISGRNHSSPYIGER